MRREEAQEIPCTFLRGLSLVAAVVLFVGAGFAAAAGLPLSVELGDERTAELGTCFVTEPGGPLASESALSSLVLRERGGSPPGHALHRGRDLRDRRELPGGYPSILTRAPSETRSKSSMTSAFRMRMQPRDPRRSMATSSGDPWM